MKYSFVFLAILLVGAFLSSCSSSSKASSQNPQDTNNNPQTTEFNRHISLGFYICGEFLPNLKNTSTDEIYRYEDGVIYVRPATGADDFSASLGDFGARLFNSNAGFTITDDSLLIKRGNALTDISYFSENLGCDGKPADLSVTVWQIDSERTPAEVFVDNLGGVPFTKTAEAVTVSLLPSNVRDIPPLPLSTLELLTINEIAAAGNLPTPQQLELVPARPDPPASGIEITQNPTPCPTLENAPALRVTQFAYFPDNCIDAKKTYTAIFQTNVGDIYVELDNATYRTTNAFVVLARYLYYDGSALFRTVPAQGFIQGGAPHNNQVDDPGPGFTIPDENRTRNYEPGQLLMARNANTNSANGQFIFTVTNNAERLGASQNTVFGKVTQGIEILQRILSLHVEDPSADKDTAFFSGGPILPIILEKVVIQEADE